LLFGRWRRPARVAGGDDERSAQEAARLIVGLGNPGEQYGLTPHNLGFLVIDRLAERNSIRVTRKECQALVGYGRLGDVRVMLAKPLTYMNLSGPSVKSLLVKSGLAADGLILVHDDFALPWTGLRIRYKGSAGGHNGVDSVIRGLGTMEFTRVRLGIDPGHPVSDWKKFVLAPMRRARKKELDEVLDYASAAVEAIVAEGVEKAMTRFNRRVLGKGEEKV